MKNRKRNTVIWLLTWAVLFLVVAYSPIGRPDLYVGNSYYINNQGVTFKGGIANAPKATSFATEEDGPEMTDYVPNTDYSADYANNAAEYSPQNAGSRAANYSIATGSNQSSGQNGSIILAANSSKSAQGTATQSNDVSSLSSDLTLTSSASTDRQAVKPSKIDGGEDPGRHHPNPVPVGDGLWFLLLMAGGYLFRKKHQAAKGNSTVRQ